MTIETLSAAMKTQRLRQGLTHKAAVAKAGTGISVALWSRIENGNDGPYRPSTLAAIDRALTWTLGTAESMLRGTIGAALTTVDNTEEFSSHAELTLAVARLLKVVRGIAVHLDTTVEQLEAAGIGG